MSGAYWILPLLCLDCGWHVGKHESEGQFRLTLVYQGNIFADDQLDLVVSGFVLPF